MVKRVLAAGVLLVAVACSDTSKPTATSLRLNKRSVTGEGVAAMQRTPGGGAAIKSVVPALPRAPELGLISGRTVAKDVVMLTETFDNPLSGWKTRFMGQHSNLRNYYTQYDNCFSGEENPDDCRGNNLDGLWIADDNNESPDSYIRFDSEFAASVTSIAFDLGSHVRGTLTIYDKEMHVLLQEAIPLGCSNCEYDGGEQVYSHHSVRSTNGVAGFDVVQTDELAGRIEGNVGIDNIVIEQGPGDEITEPVPPDEPATITVKEDGKSVAGVDVPINAFAEQGNGETINVTVKFKDLGAGETCHDYLMGQLTSKCLTVTALKANGEKATLAKRITVGFCLPEHPQLELFKFETPSSRAIPLLQRNADFLDCTDFQLGSRQPKNWMQGLASRVGKWLTPKSAYASDNGFGGDILPDLGLSSFTWAPYIEVAFASLTPNILRSGKDGFSVVGRFNLAETKNFEPGLGENGFNPAVHPVTVAYGKVQENIAPSCFKLVLGRYICAKATGVVNAIDINPTTGGYAIAGRTPGETDPAMRPFTLQIGNRTRGVMLLCGVNGICKGQHPHAP